MNVRETSSGLFVDHPQVVVFFGNKNSTLEQLRLVFPDLQWARIRQTHSDLVLPSSRPLIEDLPEADAHWSSVKNLGLLISTADCVPVMIFDPKTSRVAAIHAGWRGVASRIVPKTLRSFLDPDSAPDRLEVWIGPHIGFDSFEVGTDVKDLLLLSAQKKDDLFLRPGEPSKFFVNLSRIVRAQLLESGVRDHQIWDTKVDTKVEDRFHSHRRDRERAGWQLSFISLK